MKRHLSHFLLVSLALFGCPAAEGAVLEEDFSGDPKTRHWRCFGEESLFQWDSDSEYLEVTWDSSRTNSYFHRGLGTVLTTNDDFTIGFDLRLTDIAIGVVPNKPYTFQIAIGLINLSNAVRPDFFRGRGVDAEHGPRSAVEFNYFPDSGFGATVAPTVISTNNRIRFSDNHPLELTPGDWFRVGMSYTAADRILRSAMTRNGVEFGLPPDSTIRNLSLAGFDDFRVDTIALTSYSDVGQVPPEFSGSVLAHGVVDNVRVTFPEPPLTAARGSFDGNVWGVAFDSLEGWGYVLERTTDLDEWEAVTDETEGTGDEMVLVDLGAGGGEKRFYRVKAGRR